MRKTGSRITAIVLVVGTALLASGCVSTFKEVKPLGGGPPPVIKPCAVALGNLKITDVRLSQTERQVMAKAFGDGFEKWFGEPPRLELLKDVVATNLPPGAILLEGTITEIEKGSAAARFWVGMGAGQQRAAGEFVVRSPEGNTLTAFTARKSYLGGQGIGGWDMLKLEDLVSQLGQLVAETMDKWLRNGEIK
jgi:hypothetical protein